MQLFFFLSFLLSLPPFLSSFSHNKEKEKGKVLEKKTSSEEEKKKKSLQGKGRGEGRMVVFGILIPLWLIVPFIALVTIAVFNLLLWIIAPIIGIKIIFKIVKILFRIIRIFLPVIFVAIIFYLLCSACCAGAILAI